MADVATVDDERSPGASAATLRTRQSLPIGGEINGRYRIEAVLGQGGMGVVYRASDRLHAGRRLAIKVIHDARGRASRIGLFKAEFKITAAFRHPHIAEVYDFEPMIGSDDYLFTMECVNGRDLFSATRDASPEAIVALLVQVLHALSYVHSRQVIHFDLKPANILVDDAGGVKVLDFGLAGLTASASDARFGTPAYMAPELAKPGAFADHRVDLYSLGIVAFQLLCGRLPFAGDSALELLRQHVTAPLVFPPESRAPEWLRAIVLRLTAKEPSDRFRSANAVIAALSRGSGTAYEIETSETRESYILSSRFVGRDAELTSILDFVERRTQTAATGEMAWFVCGPSGVGKSRLLREVRHQIQMSHRSFVEANCYERGSTEYAPIADVVRHVARLADATGHADVLRRFAPVLTQIEPQLGVAHSAAPPLESAEAERLRLIDRVSEFLIAIASRTPLVVYLNDLQWAQPGTIDVLAYLLQLLRQRESAGQQIPIAILGSLREDESEGRPIAALLALWRAAAGVRETTLAPLGPVHIEALVCSMLGVPELPAEFVARVATETAGVPFFVEEVMRALVENGSVFLRDGAWAASKRIFELEIPGSMAHVFLRRFSFLDEEARTVVELLASSGRPAAPELLAEVSGLESAAFHQALTRVVQRGMAIVDHERCRPMHDSMRESVYDSLPAPRRQALHARFGAVIEARHANALEPHLFELAHHFRLAGDRDKGLVYSLRAGDDAKLHYSNHAGIELYLHALELLGHDAAAEQERLEVNEKLGDLYYLVGRYDECPHRFEAALKRTDAPLERAKLYRKLGQVCHSKAEYGAMFDKLWSAVELLGGRRPRSALGSAWLLFVAALRHLVDRFLPFLRRVARSALERERLRELSAIYLRLGYGYYFKDPLAGFSVAMLSLSAAERAGTSTELCHSLSATNVLYEVLTFYRRAEAYGVRGLEMARTLRAPWHIANAQALLGLTRLDRGDWRDAEACLGEAFATFAECGDMFELGASGYNLARCLYYQGRLEDAAAIVQENIDATERTGSLLLLPPNLLLRGIVAVKLGHVERGFADLERALTLAEASAEEHPNYLCQAHMWLGDALLTCHQPARAVEHLERAERIREDRQLITSEVAPIYAHLARARLADVPGDETAAACRTRLKLAARAADKALAFARRRPSLLPAALVATGMCDWHRRRRRHARQRFDRAIALAEAQGAHYLLAQALAESGHCLAAGAGDDLEVARARLERAAAVTSQSR